MWWRALLAAAVLTCTVTLAQGPQQLNQIKDVLCVMLLNSIQKEDLTLFTRGLQNVNSTNDTLQSDIRQILGLTNKTDVEKGITINDNEVKLSHDNTRLESNKKLEKNQTNLNKTQSNINNKRIENNNVEKHLRDDEKTSCDIVMNYKNGQPTLLSLFNFWKNCLNISKPIENNDMEINLLNKSASVQNKQNIATTTQMELKQVRKHSENDIKIRYYDEDAIKSHVRSEMKPEVKVLQNSNKKSLRSNSEESFKLNVDTNNNHLDDNSSTEYTVSHTKSRAKNNSVEQNLSLSQLIEPASLIYPPESAKESRSKDNLYYGEYEKHDYLHSKDFYNIEEPIKVYKSGYGNIFYAYNETDGNALNKIPYQFKDILSSLSKKPTNNFLDGNQFNDRQSELDIKLLEVFKLLKESAASNVNLDNILPNMNPVRRQLKLSNNQIFTTDLSPKNFDSTESTKRYLEIISTTINTQAVSVPNEQYVNYLPPGNRVINAEYMQNRVKKLSRDIIPNGLAFGGKTYSHISQEKYFYPENTQLKRVVNYQKGLSHKFEIKTYPLNLFEPIREIKSASAEVVSVSSIHYVNYLYPRKATVKSVRALKETKKISRIIPVFSKRFVYSRETDEHNYHEYEKVNIIARNHNHNSYYFYPEISQKLHRIELHLPGIYFSPNIPEQSNGKLKEHAHASDAQEQDSLLKNVTENINESYLRNRIHNVNLCNLAPDRAINPNKPFNTAPCTQKHANTADRRMSADAKINEYVIIDENNVLPRNIITNIADSIKIAIKEDLRKELNKASSTKPTTELRDQPSNISTTPTVKIAETTTQILSVTQKTMTQDIVLENIMKYLEQMNTSENPQNKNNNFQFSNRNIKTLNTDVEILKTETYLHNLDKQKNYDITNRRFLALPKRKNKATVRKDMKRQKMYFKDKKIEPKTFQTNELQIAPLSVYVGSLVSPVNQNIIVPTRIENSGDKRNKNYYNAAEGKKIQNSPFPPNHRTNIPSSNIRTSRQYKINIENNDISEEHKDVEYLDEKFLNRLSKVSNAPKHPLNKDCCDREYLSQLMYDCCNDKVVSRQLEPLIDRQPKDDTFIQSQHKVNAMLARALASKSKFRSVESI